MSGTLQPLQAVANQAGVGRRHRRDRRTYGRARRCREALAAVSGSSWSSKDEGPARPETELELLSSAVGKVAARCRRDPATIPDVVASASRSRPAVRHPRWLHLLPAARPPAARARARPRPNEHRRRSRKLAQPEGTRERLDRVEGNRAQARPGLAGCSRCATRWRAKWATRRYFAAAGRRLRQ